jgi:glycosyltransferase involved in cell wall biosynthesis
MKILHLSSERTWRGGEQQIAYLIEELEKAGVENYVACRKNSAFEKYCIDKSISYFSFSFRFQYDLLAGLELKKICEEFEINIIHVHSSFSHGMGYVSAMLGNRTPIILSRRVDFPIKKNLLTQLKYNHTSIKRILCVSKTIESMVRAGIKKPDRCLTVYSGIDLNRFENINSEGYLRKTYSLDNDTILIGNISAIAPHKDYFTFVDTAEIVLQNNLKVYFFIIGDGPNKQEISEYINQKGLDSRIILTGFQKEVPKVLAELNIFLITSKTEGLGTTVLDAFASGTPVVATRGGGITETVLHEQTGLLADVGDTETLASNIKILIENKELQNTLTKNAKQKVLEFSKEQTAQKTLEVYNSVVKRKSQLK